MRVVSCSCLLGDPLFRVEALVDDLEENATAFLSSLLPIVASRTAFFPDPLFGPDPLLEILLVEGNPVRLIKSPRVVLLCAVIDPMNSLLEPEPPWVTLLVEDANSRARPTARVEPAKRSDSVIPGLSSLVAVARLRNNLSSPV